MDDVSADERWTDFDDAMVEYVALPEGHPVKVAHTFWHAIRDSDTALLPHLITPESRKGWGNFDDAARAMLLHIENMGLGAHARSLDGIDDVCYIAAYADITRGGIYDQSPTAYLTLIDRPEHGGWLIHAFGPAVPPALLPRSTRRKSTR